MPPQGELSEYEKSLRQGAASGVIPYRVETSKVKAGSSSLFSIEIYQSGPNAGRARLIEWSPDGSRRADGQWISTERVNTLINRPAGVSPGGGQPSPAQTVGTNAEIQKQLDALRGIKQDSNGIYNYNGRRLTKTQWQSEIDRLQGVLDERQIAGQQTTKNITQQVSQERDKLVQYIADFNQRLQFAKTIVDNSKDPDAVTRATGWVNKLQADLNKMAGFLKTIDSTGKMPAGYVLPPTPTPQDIQSKNASTPVQTSGAPLPGGYPGQAVGQVSTTSPTGPLTSAQLGDQGIGQNRPVLGPEYPGATQQLPAGFDMSGFMTGTKPAGGVSTPAATTPVGGGASGGAGAPAGPGMTVTDPATGQPVTLPAGIDFAWLASQTPSTPPAWEQAAIELYGGYYEVIKNIPELRGLIGRAMTGGWSEDKFQYELEQTTWWRTTTASARAWEEQKVRDPASLQTLIDNKTAAIRDEALTLGIRIDDASLSKLAEDSLKFGWSDQVLTNAVGMEALKSQAGVSQLRQGYYGQSIKSIASNYGVPLSDTVTNQWIAKIASGQENEASFQAYVRDLSKNLYPALSSGFDRGLTFGQMTSPYAQYASNILEIPEAQVDFTDPKWAAAFTMKDAKGQQTQMSFGEWADYLRTNPAFGYEYTDGAQEKAYQVANQLARLFGAA